MTIRLGFQIPNFSYGTGVEQLFPTVIAQAREAESAGFDAVFVMDHFYQLPMLGSPDQPMLEAYTALGALATATERVQLGARSTHRVWSPRSAMHCARWSVSDRVARRVTFDVAVGLITRAGVDNCRSGRLRY